LEDHEAAAAIRRGDRAGLDALVRRYQTKAARVAYLITHDADAAQDVMQSAFVQMYERIDQYDPARRFEPWFMRIVVNLALKAVGSRASRLNFDLTAAEFLPDPAPDPAAQVEEAEQVEAVRRALKSLPPEQRAVIVLRYYLGYSEGEISTQLGDPLGTIRWRLHTARKTLRRLLGRDAR
jgi:RNA polymerase sigma-70 factor (ECF subfamily)